MSFALIGRRRWLRGTLALAGVAVALPRANADPAAVAPIRELCDRLLEIMRAGQATPFPQRFATLAPVIDRAFDLPAILQLSIGPSWSGLASDQQTRLLTAFRRYTVANYVNSFDNYNGQHFDVSPDTKSLPNGEQLAQTKIISSSGNSTNWITSCAGWAVPGRRSMCWRTARSAVSRCSAPTSAGWSRVAVPRR